MYARCDAEVQQQTLYAFKKLRERRIKSYADAFLGVFTRHCAVSAEERLQVAALHFFRALIDYIRDMMPVLFCKAVTPRYIPQAGRLHNTASCAGSMHASGISSCGAFACACNYGLRCLSQNRRNLVVLAVETQDCALDVYVSVAREPS